MKGCDFSIVREVCEISFDLKINIIETVVIPSFGNPPPTFPEGTTRAEWMRNEALKFDQLIEDRREDRIKRREENETVSQFVFSSSNLFLCIQ
jgi:hypothetical protein